MRTDNSRYFLRGTVSLGSPRRPLASDRGRFPRRPTHILEIPMLRLRPWFLFGVICAVSAVVVVASLPNVRRRGTATVKGKGLPAATMTTAHQVRRVADERAGRPIH